MRGLRPNSLQGFIIILILMVLVPSLGLMINTVWKQRAISHRLAQKGLENLVERVAQEQSRLVAGTQQLLMSISQLPAVKDPARAAACQQVLSQLLKPHPYYTNLGVAGADGEMYCSALPMPHRVNISDRLYFQRSMRNHGFGVGEYQIGRITGVPAVNFSHALTNEDDEVVGAVFAALSLQWFRDIVTHADLPEGARVKVIDSNGQPLVAYREDAGADIGEEVTRALQERVRGGARHGSFNLISGHGESRYYAYASLLGAASDVYVVAGVPATKIAGTVNEAFVRNIGLLVLVSVVIAVAAWIFSRLMFLKRIHALTDTAKRLRDGELGTHSGLEHARDELGDLAQAFDNMSESLQGHQRELELTSIELTRTNRALRTLSACNRILVHADDARQLLEQMCRVIVEQGRYKMAWIGIAQDDGDKSVKVVAGAGVDSDYLRSLGVSWADNELGRGPTGTAIRENRIVMCRDTHNDMQYMPWRHGAMAQGYQASIALPLELNGQQAALNIYAVEKDAFDEHEVKLLEELVQDIAYGTRALHNRERQVEAEARVRHLAFYDPLTDLPNRYLLEQRLTEYIEHDNRSLAILLVNIDRFKEINNIIGYYYADEFLKMFGPRLQSRLPSVALVARTGGDIFGILLPQADERMARDVARRIQELGSEPYEIEDVTLDVSLTIGISLYPDHGTDTLSLVRRASLAMHEAKQNAESVFTYDPVLDQGGARRLTLAADLRRSIEREQLQLYVQPKVDMHSDAVIAVEALVRWTHPEFGEISPAEFIPLAEHTGFIAQLTDWVLEQSVLWVAQWRSQGMDLPVAVNLSVRNLYQPDLVERINALCRERGVPVASLELEVTESALMEDPARCQKSLHELHAQGMHLYIDDYGTGYSSLGYVKRLPMTAIKIDKSFILDMQRSTEALTIVKSTIAMAHELGKAVVAEGVENKPLYDMLAALGCDYAQGYFIARPQPAVELTDWLQAGPWSLWSSDKTSRGTASGNRK